jgi:hypothetical protein
MIKWGYLNDKDASRQRETIQTMAHLLVYPLVPGLYTQEYLITANYIGKDVVQY